MERVHLTDGSKTSFTDYWYDYFGNRNQEQDGRGNQTDILYDLTYFTFPRTITNAKGQVETRTYNAATGKPVSITDINGQATTYEYDAFKRLTAVRRPGDATGTPTLGIVYESNTGQAAPRFAIATNQKDGSIVDGVLQGKTWYDGLGRAVQTRSENVFGLKQIVVDTAFDGRGLQLSQSVPYESATSTWDYTTPDGSKPKTISAYEGLRRLSQVTNPDGTIKRWFYPGRTTTIVDENNHQRDLVEDPLGRLAQVKEYLGTYPNATLYATTGYAYNALDNLLQITDAAGNLIKMEYNSLGQRVKLHDPDLCGGDPLLASYWWTYEFDLAGNMAKQTDAKGQVVTVVYDELNRPTRKHYSLGWVDDPLTTNHSPGVYDLMEIRASIDVDRIAAGLTPNPYAWNNPAIVAGKDVTIRAIHFNEMRDPAIQGLWNAAAMGGLQGFNRGTIQVDPPRPISLQDPADLRGWLVQYENSTWAGQNGRRARAVYRWDDYSDSGYNPGFALGRRTEMWDASGHTRWTYDLRGRIIKEEKWIDGAYYPTEWTYDAMDRVLTMKYPDGEIVTYGHNERGLLASLTSSVAGNIATEIAYKELGLPAQVKLPNAASDLYLLLRYHALDAGSATYPYGALWDVRLQKGSELLRLQHFYDYARNITRIVDTGTGGGDFTYVLDELDRLLTRKITGGADQETVEFDSVPGRTDGRIGNIVRKNGQLYTYGSKPHAVTDGAGVPHVYDDNGNMTQRGTSQYIKYDAENRPVKVSSDSGGAVYVARFAHDGDGRRVKRVDNYGTIHYVGAHYERNVGTGADPTEVITRFYYAQLGGMRRLIALRRRINGVEEALRYIVPDHLGGTARVVDTSGNWIDDIRYNAFGTTRSGGANTPTDKRFTGQTLDLSTGLYWYGSRAYDPVLGRFVQPDTIVPQPVNPQSLNRYAYVLNNPLRYIDPTGHDGLDPDWEAAFKGEHGRDPTWEDWRDREISLLASGSGPGGAWTQGDWEALTAAKPHFGGIYGTVTEQRQIQAALALLGRTPTGRATLGDAGIFGVQFGGGMFRGEGSITYGGTAYLEPALAHAPVPVLAAQLGHEAVHIRQQRALDAGDLSVSAEVEAFTVERQLIQELQAGSHFADWERQWKGIGIERWVSSRPEYTPVFSTWRFWDWRRLPW